MRPIFNGDDAAGVAVAPSGAIVELDLAPPNPSVVGRVHAVPVIDIIGSSGWLAETLYRGFEILVALFGLSIGLSLMLFEAALIRWEHTGVAVVLP